MTWTPEGGGDHGGADWIISADDVVSNTHTGIGVFRVDIGITATTSVLKVSCIEADIQGIIAATNGGAGGVTPGGEPDGRKNNMVARRY
jgi:hypothetical protein